MSSTYSSSLRVELIGSGDQAGAWGATTDNSFAYVFDTAIAGYQAVPITSTSQALTYVNGATATANLNQAVYAMLKFTGASAATSVYIPPASKQYIVYNNSGYAITIYNSTVIGNTTAAGTGITVANGDKTLIWSDGTNVLDVKSSGITGTLPIANGGTGQTTAVAGFNALSTSAVYIDGSSNVGIGTTSPTTKFTVQTAALTDAVRWTDNVNSTGILSTASGLSTMWSTTALGFGTGAVNYTERMRIDSSGNVGIGLTPNAWSGSVVLQMTGPSLWGSSGLSHLSTNTYFDGTNYKYIATNFVTDYYQLSGTHVWRYAASGTAGTNVSSFNEAMRIDSSGNVGIGTTSPSSYGKLVSLGTDNANLFAAVGATNMLRVQGYNSTYVGTVLEAVNLAQSANTPMFINASQTQFGISGTEAMRIDTSGNLTIGGTTSVSKLTVYGTSAYSGYSSAIGAWASANYNSASSGQLLGVLSQFTGYAPNDAISQFYYGLDTGGLRFAVKGNGGISNYSANNTNLSDRREKTNFAPAGNYLAKICAIPVQTFNYIDQNFEEDDGLTLGVVAQDVQAVAPELVIESNWGTIEEPRMRLSIYQTDLQYALMKCIQEQQSLIQSLTTRITALETK
jgi:Chaperone of endosialidase